MWEKMHSQIPPSCNSTHTNSFHGRPMTTDAGKACKACCENTPFISPFPTWNMYTLTDYLQPFSFPLFPNRRASCQAKRVSLPSSSVCASHCLCHLLLFAPQSLHPKDSSLLCDPPPPPLPSPLFELVWPQGTNKEGSVSGEEEMVCHSVRGQCFCW